MIYIHTFYVKKDVRHPSYLGCFIRWWYVYPITRIKVMHSKIQIIVDVLSSPNCALFVCRQPEMQKSQTKIWCNSLDICVYCPLCCWKFVKFLDNFFTKQFENLVLSFLLNVPFVCEYHKKSRCMKTSWSCSSRLAFTSFVDFWDIHIEDKFTSVRR